MTQQNTQAVVLQQPTDQMVHLDLQHSTDWVVVISVVGSAFISFIGFLITIYVVKKSTESQIESNIELIKSQESQKNTELDHASKQIEVDRALKYGGELIICLDKFILELYRLSALDSELYRANIYEKVIRLTQLNEEILSKFVLLGLLMKKGSKEYERIYFVSNLFLRISWDIVDEVRDLKFIADLTIKTEMIEDIQKDILIYSDKFNESEIKKINKIMRNNSYDALIELSANCASEIHDYIFNKKAA